MFRVVIATFISLTLVCVTPQVMAAGKNDKAGETTTQGAKKRLSTIVFAGLAGAILGLSTLSFYGRPQDKLNNIAVGAAVGIIGGAIYSTFKAATETHEYYNLRDEKDGLLYAMQAGESFQPALPSYTPKMQFTFSF